MDMEKAAPDGAAFSVYLHRVRLVSAQRWRRFLFGQWTGRASVIGPE
jgi:hypothetical protein